MRRFNQTWNTSVSAAVLMSLLFGIAKSRADDAWIVLEGQEGAGKGKHIVLVCGDDEYRSEELMPQLAKNLAEHHGFRCTVLFAINKQTGQIDALSEASRLPLRSRAAPYRHSPPKR